MPTWIPELLQVEWEQEISEKLSSFPRPEESLRLLLKNLEAPFLKEIDDRIAHLHTLESQEKEKQFFLLRRSLLEMITGLKLYLDSPLAQKEASSQKEALSALSLLQDLLQKTSSWIPFIQEIRTKRFQTLSIEEKREQLPISEENYNQVVSFLKQHRLELEKALLDHARSLLIPIGPDLPFPLVYSIDGRLYCLSKTIQAGSGRGKRVFKILEAIFGDIVAWVQAQIPSLEDPEHRQEWFYNKLNIWKESLFLQKLQGSKGVIQIQNLFMFRIEHEVELYEIMEFFGSEDLSSLLRKRRKNQDPSILSKGDEAKIAYDILKGLEAIHSHGIFHRDLKPSNILVQRMPSKPPQAKIIDFNFACFRQDSAEKNKVCFHAYYCAPEYARVLIETDFKLADPLWAVTTDKLDVWNMGCILYLLFFHSPLPWTRDVSNKLEEAENKVSPEIRQSLTAILQLTHSWIDPHFQTHLFYPLVEKMLQVDPAKRLSAFEAVSEFEKIISRKN